MAIGEQPAVVKVSLRDVGWLRERLESYRSPEEIRRMSESLGSWLPLREALFELLAETREDGWPYQTFPNRWDSSARAVLSRLDELLAGEVACHFPQRSTSAIRELAAQLEQALSDPARLTGRQVGRARRILCDSEARWGAIGSDERRRSLKQRGGDLPVTEQARCELLRRLEPYSEHRGLEKPEGLLEPLADGRAIPRRLAQDVEQCRLASPRELAEFGVVSNLQQLAGLAPNWVELLRPTAEGALGCARELISISWTFFPEQSEPQELVEEISTLLSRAGFPRPERDELVRHTRECARDTLYESYYRTAEVDRLEHGLSLEELCRQRAAARGKPEEMPPARLDEELRLLEAAGLWYFWDRLRPSLDARAAAWRLVGALNKAYERPRLRRNQRWQRHREVAHLWQRLLFFLSLLPPGQLPAVLRQLGQRSLTSSELRAALERLSEVPSVEGTLVGWSFE